MKVEREEGRFATEAPSHAGIRTAGLGTRSSDVRTRQSASQVGFRLEVIYADVDIIELRVSAWNGAFGGATDLYVAVDGLSKIATELAGFPKIQRTCASSL